MDNFILAYSDLLKTANTVATVMALSVAASMSISEKIKKYLIHKITILSIAAMMRAFPVDPVQRNKLSSEAAIMAANGFGAFFACSIICFLLTVIGFSTESGLFHDFRFYTLGILIIIFAYRVLLGLRVARGFYGLNEAEAIEFYIWVKAKSEKGDDDFGGKAVEEVKQDFLRELGYDQVNLPGAHP